MRESIAAAELLAKDFKVQADIWSCPSFNELKRDGDEVMETVIERFGSVV